MSGARGHWRNGTSHLARGGLPIGAAMGFRRATGPTGSATVPMMSRSTSNLFVVRAVFLAGSKAGRDPRGPAHTIVVL